MLACVPVNRCYCFHFQISCYYSHTNTRSKLPPKHYEIQLNAISYTEANLFFKKTKFDFRNQDMPRNIGILIVYQKGTTEIRFGILCFVSQLTNSIKQVNSVSFLQFQHGAQHDRMRENARWALNVLRALNMKL